ncbi:Fc receptor, IgE, high affinity I, gamma polypeptide like [Cheilinus undulatus]|uniref:Fc receptor, IgE, high affinity I, gamma polypeptide like n=1 Tax=Cheilinus undulatus TaxID=241271 RepID=UPI001BD4D754|nr:Fc receptor, IgE, high affinity I, gamma polypeptide like [Cheilinus undulatus]
MLRAPLIAAFLMINPTCAEAIGDMGICYILDGILILYGIILTVLYCRLRVAPAIKAPAKNSQKKPVEGGIYAGLTCKSSDTYETIRTDKKPIV